MENEVGIKIVEYDDLKKKYDTLQNNSRSLAEYAKDLEI